jgi:acyl-CoA thioester hydrolase
MRDLVGDERQAGAPFQTTTIAARVLYADTDRMGVVYHATYLRWFEAGRAAYMRRRGSSYRAVEESGVLLPVIEANAVYLKPARYDDVINVTARLGEIGRAQLKFDYEITKGGTPLVRGFTRHAVTTAGGRPTRLPASVRAALESGETTGGGEPVD